MPGPHVNSEAVMPDVSPPLTAADLAAARRSEPAAVGRLYQALGQPLLTFFLVATGDRHEAENHTGAAFSAAVAALPTFDRPVDALTVWVFTLARRQLHAARTPGDRPRPWLRAALASSDARRPLRPDAVIARASLLPPDERDVLALRMAGLTVAEVAEVADLDREMAVQLQRLALARLAGGELGRPGAQGQGS